MGDRRREVKEAWKRKRLRAEWRERERKKRKGRVKEGRKGEEVRNEPPVISATHLLST